MSTDAVLSPRYLAHQALEWGVDSLVWLPSGGPAQTWPRPMPAEVDWDRVLQLGPGHAARTGDWGRSSPRSARCPSRGLWVATPEPGPDSADNPSSMGHLGLYVDRTSPPREFESMPLAALQAMAQNLGLAQATEQLRATAKAHADRAALGDLGTRAAGVLHDLRNQLTLTSLLASRGQATTPSDAAATWEEIGEHLGTARALCVQALASDPGPVQSIPLRRLLVAEAQSANLAARPKAGDPPRLRVRCGEQLQLVSRPAPLARLLRNLLWNAIEASYAGGCVDLSALASRRGGGVDLLVEDAGRGMHASALHRLYSVGESGSGSTGLGTASLRDCLMELGAELSLASSPGRGTRVRVRLPDLGAAKGCIVLVDPDVDRRKERATELASRAEVRPWSLPSSALDDLGRCHPSLVLLTRGCSGPGHVALRRSAFQRGIPLRILPAAAGVKVPAAWLALTPAR